MRIFDRRNSLRKNKEMKIEINKERLNYLLALYKMTVEDLLSLLNEGRKKPINKMDITGDTIELALLKHIDKILGRGLNFYSDFSPLAQSANSSVFFRKSKFGTELNMESMRIVHKFEILKQTLDSYNKLSRLNVQADIAHYTIDYSPIEAARTVRRELYPGAISNVKKFLIALISKCADHNIFVFEYIETWNKKEKTNIDGVYLQPNMIVLKHHKHYKREIFTLAHELGHCILGEEEVEPVDMMAVERNVQLSEVERWCNDFAFHFIMGEEAEELNNIQKVNADHDYYMDYVAGLSARTHISRLAIFTRLFLENKMTFAHYNTVRANLAQEYKLRTEREKEQKEETKSFGMAPKPIISPLFLKTMQYAYFKGIVNEMAFCKHLNIKPDNFEKVLWQ